MLASLVLFLRWLHFVYFVIATAPKINFAQLICGNDPCYILNEQIVHYSQSQ